MNDDQLARLCAALRANTGRIISVGFNRLRNPFGKWNREMLWTENGELMQNWFVSGHEIAPDDWSAMEEDDGRVLGNLCHWTDLTYQMMPPERRFPIRITPTRSAKSDCDVAVTYVFGDGSVGVISFCAVKGYAFQCVRERYSAHRGDTPVAMDGFRLLMADVSAQETVRSQRRCDHGQEGSAAEASDRGFDMAYVWEPGQLFLRTKEALESSRPLSLDAWWQPADGIPGGS
jgi:hypothetical protein